MEYNLLITAREIIFIGTPSSVGSLISCFPFARGGFLGKSQGKRTQIEKVKIFLQACMKSQLTKKSSLEYSINVFPSFCINMCVILYNYKIFHQYVVDNWIIWYTVTIFHLTRYKSFGLRKIGFPL